MIERIRCFYYRTERSKLFPDFSEARGGCRQESADGGDAKGRQRRREAQPRWTARARTKDRGHRSERVRFSYR